MCDYQPEQVQDFIPTPGSLSTCMYYSGINPLTGEKVYVATNPHEKRLQRALLQYRDHKNYDLVYEALEKAERMDLIGAGPKCFIRPRRGGVRRSITVTTPLMNSATDSSTASLKGSAGKSQHISLRQSKNLLR